MCIGSLLKNRGKTFECCHAISEVLHQQTGNVTWKGRNWFFNNISTYMFMSRYYVIIKVKVKWSRYRPGVAQRVGRGIALLFHDRGTRREWVVSSTPRPHFTPGKNPVPIVQEAGWAPGPVWTGGKSRPHRDSIPDRPAHSQSLYRLSYPSHNSAIVVSPNVKEAS